MKHNYSLFKKAASYAALSSAMLAAHKQANSQVLYTDVNQDVFLNDDDFYQIDLNNDGLYDLALHHHQSNWSTWYESASAYVIMLGSNEIENSFSNNEVGVLNGGDTIGANNNWVANPNQLAWSIYANSYFFFRWQLGRGSRQICGLENQ